MATVYVVTGGLGFLGKEIVTEILRTDQQANVRIVSRTGKPEHNPFAGNRNVSFYASDLAKETTFAFLKDATYVIHNAALVSFAQQDSDKMFALNVGGTVAIAKACEKFAITRLVYVSSISAIGKPKNSGEYATEEFFNDPNDTNSNAYTQSKALAEIELHKAITTLDYVVGCPSVLLGAGDKKIASIISLIKKFPLIPLTAPIWSVVDVRDCAKALIFLLKSGKAKERYIITQHHVPLTTLAKQFSAALNKKSLVLTIPKRLLTILRPFAKVLQKVFPRTPFNEAAINSATSDKLFSNKKLLALGFRFTYTLDETILSIVEAR